MESKMSIQVNFDKHCKEANEWLLEIGDRAGFPDRTDWSYGCLRAVLHTLRDRTTIEEVFQLSAQLPVLIRGIYFEGYKPFGKPDKLNAEEFMSRIKKDLGNANPISANDAFRVVIELLYDRTTPERWMTFADRCQKRFNRSGISIDRWRWKTSGMSSSWSEL